MRGSRFAGGGVGNAPPLRLFIILAGLLAAALLPAQSLEDALARGRFSPEQKRAIEEQFREAALKGIPVSLLLPRLEEGIAKKVPAGRLQEALRGQAGLLLEARALLSRNPRRRRAPGRSVILGADGQPPGRGASGGGGPVAGGPVRQAPCGLPPGDFPVPLPGRMGPGPRQSRGAAGGPSGLQADGGKLPRGDGNPDGGAPAALGSRRARPPPASVPPGNGHHGRAQAQDPALKPHRRKSKMKNCRLIVVALSFLGLFGPALYGYPPTLVLGLEGGGTLFESPEEGQTSCRWPP